MMKLHEILGLTATSQEAAEALAPYPNLRAHTEDLGPGEDSVRYLSSEADGVLIRLSSEGRVRTVFLMSEGKDGFTQFGGELPGGLTFTSTRADALRTFGAPASYRPGGKIGTLEFGELVRFDRPTHSIHFQFRRDGGGIELVTMMSADAVPGRARETGGLT